jgi:hypothetical protein
MATTRKTKAGSKAKPPTARRDTVADAVEGEVRKPDNAAVLPRPTIRELAVEHLQHPDEWLDHPHPQFGGRTPNEMIAAGHEDKIRNLFFCLEHGLF